MRKGRGFLTLLAVVWLNVVFQPCAMAMVDAIGCPDCPPAMTMADDHGGHGDAVEHDMGSADAVCAGELIDCFNLEDVNQSARQEQPAPEPGLVWIVPAPEQCQHGYDHGSPGSFLLGDPVRLAGAFPPLNVLYCVYLD